MIDLHRWEDEGGRIMSDEELAHWQEVGQRIRQAILDDVERLQASVSGGRVMSDGDGGCEHEDFETEDQRVKTCLERHGFYMRPGPGEALWVFIPVGVDRDGAPLTRARRSFADEARAWREGRFNDIARQLKAEGHPVRVDRPRRRNVLARLLTALRRIAWRWTA